jgi:transcription termination factor Rho
MEIHELEALKRVELVDLARKYGVPNSSKMKKEELVEAVKKVQPPPDGTFETEGILDIMPDGFGFLRSENYEPGAQDIYLAQKQIRLFKLRQGDLVRGRVRQPRDRERYLAMLRVEGVNGLDAEQFQIPGKVRQYFEDLIPIYPTERIPMETNQREVATRLIDLIAPVGKGQRGLIVSPPKAGKTILLKKVANAIKQNSPDLHLMVLLIDERPEEVTDMERSVQGEVISSTFDETPDNHVRVAELVLERAKRLVELKQDVVILLDSITRLARAYNLTVSPSGRTLSGGIDPAALHKPKRFFGAARNIEEGGSLTILATALVDTGSKMDDIIYEEFKGTGNMELHLDRRVAERRIFPAMDLRRSGTRREDLLFSQEELETVFALRRILDSGNNAEINEVLINKLILTKNNKEFMQIVQKDIAGDRW